MNTLLDPLKRIARDLVDKRLWPVAVLLIAAIAGVPMLVGSDKNASAPVPLAVTAAETPAAKSLVTAVDPATTARKDRPGKITDPFYDPPAPPEPATAASVSRSGAPSGSADAPKDRAMSATAKPAETPTQTTSKTQPVPHADAPSYYRTRVRWYETAATKPGSIARLTPFGGPVDRAAMFLGVTKSKGTYAMFLLGPTATSHGEGTCDDETNCRVIGLKAGETQVIIVQPPDGSQPSRYRLQVTSVKRIETDAVTSRRMRAKVHPDGREVMRALWQDKPTADALGPIRYDETLGLLFKPAADAPAKKAAE